MLLALVFVLLGVATFTALGLWLGGTLSSEMVLALSNTIWFIMLGAAGYSAIADDLSSTMSFLLNLVPSVALATGLREALAGEFNWFALLVLVGWTTVGALAAKKFFSFTIKGD